MATPFFFDPLQLWRDAVNRLPDAGGREEFRALGKSVARAAVDGRAAGGLHGNGVGLILVDAGDGLGPEGIDPGVGVGNLKLET